MKRKALSMILLAALLWSAGLVSLGASDDVTDLSKFPRVREWLSRLAFTDEEKNYYGADLTQFPPRVREWIMNDAFTRDKMEKPFMIDPELKVWWSNDNNRVLFEASYTTARGYVGAGNRETWGTSAYYSGYSGINARYGEYAKFHTLGFEWQLVLETEKRLRTDPVYAEIIELAMQLCEEIEYDWRNFSGYRGPVRRTPGKRYAVCEGYTDEVTQKALRLDCVQAVQKWRGPNHTWNVLKLTDGRTLYFDLTWFDNEHINETTGEIYQTDDYDWANITFNEELFKYANVGYSSGVFAHALGVFESEVTK